MTKKLAMVLLLVAALVPRPAAALETNELLALVAMPLAVAAVSEVADVPMNDLLSFVSLLNQADVPPTQFVEVIRYVPVALEDESFVEYVRTRQQSGLSGPTLVTIIEDRYRTVYGLNDVDFDVDFVNQPQWVDTSTIVPAVVRNHPHGGPPGQLKKQRGLKTGAAVVHGVTREEPVRQAKVRQAKVRQVKVKDRDDDKPVRVTRDRDVRERKPAKIEHHQQKQERREVKVQKSHGGGGNKGQGGGGGNKGQGGGKKGKG